MPSPTPRGSGPSLESVRQTPLLIRALWFLFVGWWLTGIWLFVSWLFLATVVGAPIGVKLLNRVPMVVSLKRRRISSEWTSEDGRTWTEASERDQLPLLVRAVYFLFVGWWLGLVWTGVAYLFTLSVLGLPIAIWLFGKLPFVVSLYRY